MYVRDFSFILISLIGLNIVCRESKNKTKKQQQQTSLKMSQVKLGIYEKKNSLKYTHIQSAHTHTLTDTHSQTHTFTHVLFVHIHSESACKFPLIPLY